MTGECLHHGAEAQDQSGIQYDHADPRLPRDDPSGLLLGPRRNCCGRHQRRAGRASDDGGQDASIGAIREQDPIYDHFYYQIHSSHRARRKKPTSSQCTISSSAVNLPSYEFSPSSSENIDDILASPPSKNRCMCGSTFAELGEAAMRRLHEAEAEDVEERERVRLGFTGMSLEGGGSGDATEENYQARKEESERRGSLTPGTGRSGG